MNEMISATVSGAMHKLKSEIKTEFNTVVNKQRKELVILKQSTTEQLSKVELKVTSNITELNTRVNSLSNKVTDFEKILTNSKLHKIDTVLSEQADKTVTLAAQLKTLETKLTECIKGRLH